MTFATMCDVVVLLSHIALRTNLDGRGPTEFAHASRAALSMLRRGMCPLGFARYLLEAVRPCVETSPSATGGKSVKERPQFTGHDAPPAQALQRPVGFCRRPQGETPLVRLLG
jgi:hypothetical protein